jgi:hypothetical protein
MIAWERGEGRELGVFVLELGILWALQQWCVIESPHNMAGDNIDRRLRPSGVYTKSYPLDCLCVCEASHMMNLLHWIT